MDPDEIGPNEDLVNEFRLAHGDLEYVKNARGKVCRAIPLRLTVIKELIRRGIFPYHYEIYGVGFLELRNAFRSPWAPRSGSVLMEQWGIGVSNSFASGVYQNVCRYLGPRRIDVIELVLEADKEKENRKQHDEYKSCFEMLVAQMDAERERTLKEYLEGA